MSFQFVIDNATDLSIERKKRVVSTQSRDGTIRSTSIGGQVWVFEVNLPNAFKWSDIRGTISQLEAVDKVGNANIQINNSGHSHIVGYQGDAADYTAMTATWTTGNTITLTGGQATSGYNFKAGDFIQLGTTGSVYTVTADVPFTSNTVTLHRPIIDAAGTGVTLNVAENCVWNVVCTDFPSWRIFEHNFVNWSGPFVFVENLV